MRLSDQYNCIKNQPGGDHMLKGKRGLAWLCVLTIVLQYSSAQAEADVATRRAQVNQAATLGAAGLPTLENALKDENGLVRRAAVRALIELGPMAKTALVTALKADDPIVRRTALFALAGTATSEAVPYLAQVLADPDPLLRETAVQILLNINPRDDKVIALLKQAAKDEDPDVQRPAFTALSPFQIEPREVTLLRDRADIADHVARITTLAQFPLAKETWRLCFDKAETGHTLAWQTEKYNDNAWETTPIGTHWASGYIGVGWYRTKLDLPAKPTHLAAELVFEGVQESAWVWVNGVYVGCQDIGPRGWDRPFRLDVTQELRWGASNQITVRVLSTAAAGGIWKPITLEILGFTP